MASPILVTYEIIGPADAPETGVTSSFELLGYNTSSSSSTSTDVPTIQALREAFPYLGKFHFRAKIPLPPSSEHAWLDLAEDDAPLPVWVEKNAQQCVEIRALPLLFPKAPGEGGREDEEEEGGEGGELDFSGPDLDQDIVEASTGGGGGDEREEGYEARASSSRHRQQEEGHRRHSSSSSSYPSSSSSSWSRQLKDVGESVLTSDVARDLTKKGLKVGKQVGKQVNKLWKLVGEGLAGGGGGGGGGGGEGGGGEYPSSPQGPSAGAIRYLRKWEEALVTPPSTELRSTLWAALFPQGEGGREEGRVDWRRAGCEGEEPMRGFRGTGSMTVQFLIYFARTYPRKVRQILRRQEEEEEEGGREGGGCAYPLVGVANSLTLMLADIFKLRDGRYVHVQNVFWGLFEGGGWGTMDEIFCAALGYFDRVWVETGAGIEGFPRLVQQTRRGLEGVLGQAPVSLPHFMALAEEGGLYME